MVICQRKQEAASVSRTGSAISSPMETSWFSRAFLTGWILVLLEPASGDPRELKATPGQDVPLQCRGPRGASISLLEWRRTDLQSDHYVFFLRDGRSYEKYQHASFVGRVELKDPEMKDGDASVVLRNVSASDTGTYKCRVGEKNGGSRKRDSPEPISTTRLTVTDSAGTFWAGGNDDGRQNRLVVVLSVVVCFVVVFIAIFVVYGKRKKFFNTCHQTNPKESGDQPEVSVC